MRPDGSLRELILAGTEKVQHDNLRVLQPQFRLSGFVFLGELLNPNVDFMLTGSASRTENGTFLIPPLFRVESTVNVVVLTMFTPWFAKRRIWFMSAGPNPGNPGAVTLPMNG
jgi:hypothetical protein